jgi:hypothetical protein
LVLTLANSVLAVAVELDLADGASLRWEGDAAQDELKVSRAVPVGQVELLVGVGRHLERIQCVFHRQSLHARLVFKGGAVLQVAAEVDLIHPPGEVLLLNGGSEILQVQLSLLAQAVG